MTMCSLNNLIASSIETTFESLVILPWILFHYWMLILLFNRLQPSMFNLLHLQISHSEFMQIEDDESQE